MKEELRSQKRSVKAGYGIAIADSQTGEIQCLFFHNPDLNIYPGSSIKTLIAMAALKEIDNGNGKLSDTLKIDQPNAQQECVHWDCGQYGPGKQKTVKELLSDMIIVSNNIATNQLITWVTKDKINDLATKLDAGGLKVLRRVYDDVNPEPENKNRNQANAKGMVALYQEVLSGKRKILSRESQRFLIDLLLQQKYNDRLNAAFPADFGFYHKTGNTSDSSSGAGFFHLNTQQDVILVGLQDFHDYGPLQKVGKRLLALLLSE